MFYYFIYIGIELLLYLTILKAIEKGNCKGKIYQKFFAAFVILDGCLCYAKC